MSCDDVRKFIQAYLDGELDEHEWAGLSDHLESCADCRREARVEEQLRRAVRRGAGVAPAPASLKVRVRAALDAEDAARTEESAGRLRLWTLRLVPAAALVALGIGFLWSRVQGPRPPSSLKTSLASLAEQSIEWHRLHPPMDVTASSPEAVQRYFSDKVPFAVRPPVFPAGERARLVGARLANLREHRAVYVTYQLISGRRISVFIFDSNVVPAAGGRLVRVGTRNVRWQDVRGYNVALYTAGGTGYAVTSDMDPRGLVQLIAHSH